MNHETAYRGDALIKKFLNTKILVCGIGSLGSNLVEHLARIGFETIGVIDYDKVSESNVTTQTYSYSDVGKLKTSCLSHMCYRELGVTIDVINDKLTKKTIKNIVRDLEWTPDIIVDCFDNPEARQLIYNYSTSTKIPCLHGGMNSGLAEVIWNEDYTVPQAGGKDVCDYPLSKTLILLTVARMLESIINYIDNGEVTPYHIGMVNTQIRNIGEKYAK